jgi:predicted TPR repeat methyltransferase
MAFASYQQALGIYMETQNASSSDPAVPSMSESDFRAGTALVYLKLAFLYEDLAAEDWPQAAQHSEFCYEYFLEHADAQDTGVLTRLGNLHVNEHEPAKAVATYNRITCTPGGVELDNVWMNKALAQCKMKDFSGAVESLQRVLTLQPSSAAAQHMVTALTTPCEVQEMNPQYVVELFDAYASKYDEHVKKLHFAAPRVVRQELAKIWKERGQVSELEPWSANASIAEVEYDSEYDSAQNVVDTDERGVPHVCGSHSGAPPGTQDVLDIGCGTGLAGAWIKDHAKTLTGVDISTSMIAAAAKKGLYNQLECAPIEEFLVSCAAGKMSGHQDFDAVIATDVICYMGNLERLFARVADVLRPGGYFAFTLESIWTSISADDRACEPDFQLLTNGRFGHSPSYIDKTIDQCKGQSRAGEPWALRAVMSRDFSPRLEAGEAVPGQIYIVEKI